MTRAFVQQRYYSDRFRFGKLEILQQDAQSKARVYYILYQQHMPVFYIYRKILE